ARAGRARRATPHAAAHGREGALMARTTKSAIDADPIARMDARRRRWMRARMSVLGLALLVGAVLVVRRAWEITMVHGPGLREMAESQQLRDIRLAPKRGTIFDRHGAELAVSVDVESVFANP